MLVFPDINYISLVGRFYNMLSTFLRRNLANHLGSNCHNGDIGFFFISRYFVDLVRENKVHSN